MAEERPDSEVTRDSVAIFRHFDAPPSRVWDEWTVPERFASWFGTPPLQTPVEMISMDVRPGGPWTATMVSPEDGTKMPFVGVYREVRRPTHLAFTLENPLDPDDPAAELVTVDLSEVDGGTEMVFRQSGHLPEEQYPLLLAGYSGFFDRLAQDLTSQRGSGS